MHLPNIVDDLKCDRYCILGMCCMLNWVQFATVSAWYVHLSPSLSIISCKVPRHWMVWKTGYTHPHTHTYPTIVQARCEPPLGSVLVFCNIQSHMNATVWMADANVLVYARFHVHKSVPENCHQHCCRSLIGVVSLYLCLCSDSAVIVAFKACNTRFWWSDITCSNQILVMM